MNNITVINPMGNAVETYILYAQDRVESVTNLEGQQLDITYLVGGLVSSINRFDGVLASNIFDTAGNIVETLHDGASIEQATYRKNGQLLSISNAYATCVYSHDTRGFVTNVTQSISGSLQSSVSYASDPVGNITNVQLRIDNGELKIAYEYDEAERLTVINPNPASSLQLPNPFTLSYDSYNGAIDTVSNANVTVDYAYNILNAVTNTVYRNSSGNTVASFGYKHDVLGLITQKVSVVDGTVTTNSYTYDNLGRLTSETLTPSTPSNSPTPICYTYDLAGNRLSAGASTYTYTHNKLAGVLHDTAGNITNMVRNGVTLDLSWNSQGQLTSVSTNGVFAESYTWGPLGNRLSTSNSAGVAFHAYDGAQCVADYIANGDLIASYTWGAGIDNLLAVTVYENTTTNTYYTIKDHLNSVHALVNSSGNTVLTVNYNAWGTPLNSSLSIQNSSFRLRYLFQGREYSYASGLYNFRARWYDSNIGRWLSKDPIGLEGGLNLYLAFGNNPVNYRDPWGEEVYYSDVGGAHAGLLYSDPNSSTGYSWFGFYGEGADYPTRNNTYSQNCTTGSKALFSKGQLDDKYGTLAKVKNDSVKLDTNCGEEQKLRDTIDNFDKGHYSFPTRNCAHVTRDMLHKSGFLSSPNLQGKIYSPEGLTKEVHGRNNMRAFARGWKELNRRARARRSK